MTDMTVHRLPHADEFERLGNVSGRAPTSVNGVSVAGVACLGLAALVAAPVTALAVGGAGLLAAGALGGRKYNRAQEAMLTQYYMQHLLVGDPVDSAYDKAKRDFDGEGFSVDQINKIRRALYEMTPRKLVMLADALGIDQRDAHRFRETVRIEYRNKTLLIVGGIVAFVTLLILSSFDGSKPAHSHATTAPRIVAPTEGIPGGYGTIDFVPKPVTRPMPRPHAIGGGK